MYDTFLETGLKKEIFYYGSRTICSKLKKLVQNGPKFKIFVFDDMENLIIVTLLLEKEKMRNQKNFNFIEVKFVMTSQISEMNH